MTPAVERAITALTALGVGVAGQYFAVSAPNIQTREANRDARYSCLDALERSHELMDKLLETSN